MKSLLEEKEKAQIVIIEANMTVRFMLVDILRGMGYQNIFPVNDGLEASHQLKSNDIDWLIFKEKEGSVVSDVRRLRAHPLVPQDIPIHGYIYDVKTGRLVEVPGLAKVN